MRITGGTFRSRTLITPPDDHIRPTADKTRLAIFNMLNARGAVRDAVVLDIFCGTGALGLEALSHGATSCCFIDQSPVAITLARRNAIAFRCESQTTFMHMDATHLPIRPATTPPATLIFMDPPYHHNLITPTLDVLERMHWVEPEHVLYVIETEKEWAPIWPSGFNCIQTKTYGITAVHLISKLT